MALGADESPFEMKDLVFFNDELNAQCNLINIFLFLLFSGNINNQLINMYIKSQFSNSFAQKNI